MSIELHSILPTTTEAHCRMYYNTSINLANDISDKLIIDNTMKKRATRLPSNPITIKLAGTMRPSLGIFGSLSSYIVSKNPDVAENLNLLA